MKKNALIGTIIALLCILLIASYVADDGRSINFWSDDKFIMNDSRPEPFEITSNDFGLFLSPGNKYSISLDVIDVLSTGDVFVEAVLNQQGKTAKHIGVKFLIGEGAERNTNPPVVWLNEDQVLLNGRIIYQISTGQQNQILASDGFIGISSYQVNKKKDKLAIYGKKTDNSKVVRVVDLNTQEYQDIHSFIEDSWIVGEMYYTVDWGSEDQIFFDGLIGEKPVIKVFDGKTVEIFAENAAVPTISTDGKYISYTTSDNYYDKNRTIPVETKIIRISDKKEMASVNFSGQSIWSSDGTKVAVFSGPDDKVKVWQLASNGDFTAKMEERKLPQGAYGVLLNNEGLLVNLERVENGKRVKTKEMIPWNS